MSASKLVRPSVEYKDSYLDALRDYQNEGRMKHVNYAQVSTDFETYVKSLRSERGHQHQPCQEWAEIVPETIAWLVKDSAYIGTVSIRHRLNWHLERWGGHLHVIIRPDMRNKGFGKRMVLKAMPIANYLGIDKMLITIDPENKIGQKMIESCGGTYEETLPATDQFPTRMRYWLDCT